MTRESVKPTLRVEHAAISDARQVVLREVADLRIAVNKVAKDRIQLCRQRWLKAQGDYSKEDKVDLFPGLGGVLDPFMPKFNPGEPRCNGAWLGRYGDSLRDLTLKVFKRVFDAVYPEGAPNDEITIGELVDLFDYANHYLAIHTAEMVSRLKNPDEPWETPYA